MARTTPAKILRQTSRAGLGGGAILIGLALFLLFRGFGPGGTGASGSGTVGDGGKAMITTTSSPSATSAATESNTPADRKGGLTDDEHKALTGEVLTVLIDEHDFLLAIPGESTTLYRPSPLERIVELAALATGDSNGIRVQILRRQSARASAEEQLKLELNRKGIHQDAIVMPGEFVP